MIFHFVFGIAGGLFSFLGLAYYVFSVFKKEIKPNRASWIIWSITNVILLASYFSVGARPTIFLPVVYVIESFFVLIFCFRYEAYHSWSRLDYTSLFVAGISLLIWFITRNPLVALLMNLVMDSVAYLPTIKKIIINPLSENKIAWNLIFLGAVFNIFAISSLSFGIIIYPIVILIMNGIIVIAFYRKKILNSTNLWS